MNWSTPASRWSCSTICRPVSASSFPSTVPFVRRLDRRPRAGRPRLIAQHGVSAIIHFAASIVVPESVRDPLGYYRNNTMNTCAPARRRGRSRRASNSSFPRPPPSTAIRNAVPVREDAPTLPISPYGSSKLMSEIMLHDAGRGPRPALRRAALLQRRRRRSEAAHRPIDAGRHASDQGRLRGRARQARQDRRLRHRLSDAGRHLHPRLHPRQRSGARAFGGARPICAAAAPARRSTAATAAALRCSR